MSINEISAEDELAVKPPSSREVVWPVKTCEMYNHHLNSSYWNDVKFRDDDVVISSYCKSGTTWMQQIISQLIFKGDEGIDVPRASPWVDLRVAPHDVVLATIEAQTHRRFLKTHLPLDALVFSPRAKYIHLVRDGRDVAWSLYNHFSKATDAFYKMVNETPGRVGPALSRPTGPVRDYFIKWLETDGYNLFPYTFWHYLRSWFAAQDLPNILIVHYAQLKEDLSGQMHRIADFLDIEMSDELWPTLVEHCEFKYMKANAAQLAPLGGVVWEGGGGTFINKGTNGRWRSELTEEDIARYEKKAREELGEDLARFIATGYR